MNDLLADFTRAFAMSMQAHRMRDFGWESHVNDYSADQKRFLAAVLPDYREMLTIAADMQEESDRGNN